MTTIERSLGMSLPRRVSVWVLGGLLALSLFFALASGDLAEPESGSARLGVLRKHEEKLGSNEFLPFTDRSFRRFISEAPDRPYNLLLYISAPNCAACQLLKASLGAVKQAASGDSSFFLVEINSEKCKQAFRDLGITHTPVLLYLPSQNGGQSITGTTYPIMSLEHLTNSELIAEWLSETSGRDVRIPPPLWRNRYLQLILLVAAVVVFIRKFSTIVRQFYNPLFYFFASLCVYAFTFSGVIYNAIHGAPWVGLNHHTGEQELFMHDMRSQYGFEGAVIVFLNLSAAFSVILLVAWAPNLKKWWARIPLCALCFLGVASLWLAEVRLFSRHKASYYPFQF